MPAVSSDRFLEALRKSELLAADLLDAQLRRSAAEGPPEDARELATRFVRDGLLTPFQAQQLLQGKWRNFVIAGKYKVLGMLGAGGMGQVYLAEHTLMRRRSALKVLPKALTDEPAAVERFLREAQAVAALDHPNIVRAYDVDSDDHRYFLVMEFIEGVSLQDLVVRQGRVAPAAAANYVAQAARGLQHAHEAGWVHRDIKPANLLLDRSGVVKVLDLGLARLLDDETNPLTCRLEEKAVLGTADYLAPEQAVDSHAVDIRADVYSLGATLYFLLTGKPPFPDGTVSQKLVSHQAISPRPIREFRPDVPAELTAVLDRMMAKAPADRYPVPAAVTDALAPWADGVFPPPADLMPIGAGGASGAMSSWSSRPGQSGTRLAGSRSGGMTVVPGPTAPVAGETARDAVWANLAETKRIAPKPTPPPLPTGRRRWPVAIAAAAAIGIAIATIVLWPRSPVATAPVVAPAPKPEPAGKVRRFEGHTAAIENLAFTPDGKRLVTASKDKTARVWDVATGGELTKFTGHTDVVRGLAVLPDNRRVVTAGWSGFVRLWDLDTGKELQQYVGHVGEVWSVVCDADGKHLLTAGKDGTIRYWNVESAREVKKIAAHRGLVTAAVILPGGHQAVSTGDDQTIRVWDLESRKQVTSMRLPSPVYRLSLCPHASGVLFGCGKEFVRWEPGAAMQRTIIPSVDRVEGGVCLPDGRWVLAMVDGTVRVWAPNPDREVHVFPGDGGKVLSVAVAPDGRHIASGGHDKTAHLWRLPEK